MRRLLVAAILAVTVIGVAWAAEKFEDADLKISIEAPADYVKSDDPLEEDDFIGTPKVLFASPDIMNNGGLLLIHHMDIPDGDYEAWKSSLSDQLAMIFGDAYEVVEQKDVKLGDRDGMVLEFKCTGDGVKPDPDGNIEHRVRWRFIRDGDSKLVGLIYGAQEASWETLKPKITASEKSLKAID